MPATIDIAGPPDRHRGTHHGRWGEVSPHKLAHFVLRTSRFDEAKAWWADLLGARVLFDSPFLAFMTYDDEHHRVALLNDESAGDKQHTVGLDHVAFTYSGLGDLLGTYRRLSEQGVRPFWAINHGPTTSLYYHDPDGNQVELQVDNFDSEEELVEYFQTGVFRDNPIGIEFDADELLAKFNAGVPASVLVRADRDQGPL